MAEVETDGGNCSVRRSKTKIEDHYPHPGFQGRKRRATITHLHSAKTSRVWAKYVTVPREGKESSVDIHVKCKFNMPAILHQMTM